MTTDGADGYGAVKLPGYEGETLVTYRDQEGRLHPLGAFDDSLPDGTARIRAAHLEMAGTAPTPAILSRAAVALGESSPGPTTLMRRMWAAHQGLPAPTEQAFPSVVPDDGSDPEFVVGSVTVWPADGGWLRCDVRPVEITVILSFVRDGTQVDADGAVTYHPVFCGVVLDPATWSEAEGLLYGDSAVQDEVNALLHSRGLGAYHATWSEQGMQDPMVGDMDIDGRIALAVWPDLAASDAAAARRAAA